MPPWNAPRAKVQLKLSIQRLQLLQEKKTALTKQTRRDIADLLSKSKLETARVRCEVVIGDEITVELLELLALYSELVLARFALLENSPATEPDEGIKEAVCSLIFAAPRTEVKELQILRDILVHRFSRDFALSAIENRDACVNERVAKKLAIFRPPPTLIDAYLEEIARTYSVKWRAAPAAVEGDVPAGMDAPAAGEDGAAEGEGEKKDDTTTTTTAASTSTSAPPPPSYDTEKPAPKPSTPPPAPPASELDTLAARFAALKKSLTLQASPSPSLSSQPPAYQQQEQEQLQQSERWWPWRAFGTVLGGAVGLGVGMVVLPGLAGGVLGVWEGLFGEGTERGG